MPELTSLVIKSESPLEAVHVGNCPRLSALTLTHAVAKQPGTALQLVDLPGLHDLNLDGAYRQLGDQSGLGNVTKLRICGAVTSDVVRAIGNCQSLGSLDLEILDVTGAPIPGIELPEFSMVLSARVRLDTADAAWLLRLVGRMPALKAFDLRGRKLMAEDLAPLSNCTRLEQIYVRGIDDPGEPLSFLDSMPDLDKCLILACPHVGRVRLTKQSGVREFYFKYGQLDELEIDGAPNLTAVYLGNRAFGYNDDDAKLPRLDIRTLAARNGANLRYLMVDAQESKIPLTGIALADCPKLRSLTLHAPPPETQPARCRLTVRGIFSQLAQRKLSHLTTDAASLERLNDSPILRGGATEDVRIENADE
jgi:hypothetical protein